MSVHEAAAMGDFHVLENVCVTLHACAERLGESMDWPCLLNALVAATHNPRRSEEDRKLLYRLADLLSISVSRTWYDCSSVQGEYGKTLHIRCYVPPRDDTVWADMGNYAEENAQEFGRAATYLRSFQRMVPTEGFMLRAQSWIHVAQQSLTVAGQVLRKEFSSAREAEMC